MTDTTEGGCLCGAIRYQFTGAPILTSNCHCRTCRRAAGAQTVAFVVVPAQAYSVTRGEPRTYQSSPGVTRTFCCDCGTQLAYRHEARPDEIDITTGSLDAPEAFAPGREVWHEHRLHWAAANEGLPWFPRGGAG